MIGDWFVGSCWPLLCLCWFSSFCSFHFVAIDRPTVLLMRERGARFEKKILCNSWEASGVFGMLGLGGLQ